MNRLRALLNSAMQVRPILKIASPARVQQIKHHDHGPPQPFDNMPFNITNRYIATVFFSVFFGIGFWAPYLIVWYSMAKKSM